MHLFLSAFNDVPDPRADKARHDLSELLVIAFVAVLCGATTCASVPSPQRSFPISSALSTLPVERTFSSMTSPGVDITP